MQQSFEDIDNISSKEQRDSMNLGTKGHFVEMFLFIYTLLLKQLKRLHIHEYKKAQK